MLSRLRGFMPRTIGFVSDRMVFVGARRVWSAIARVFLYDLGMFLLMVEFVFAFIWSLVQTN
jgi:hypothetical protein